MSPSVLRRNTERLLCQRVSVTFPFSAIKQSESRFLKSQLPEAERA